jgi:hypothetical protein
MTRENDHERVRKPPYTYTKSFFTTVGNWDPVLQQTLLGTMQNIEPKTKTFVHSLTHKHFLGLLI